MRQWNICGFPVHSLRAPSAGHTYYEIHPRSIAPEKFATGWCAIPGAYMPSFRRSPLSSSNSLPLASVNRNTPLGAGRGNYLNVVC